MHKELVLFIKEAELSVFVREGEEYKNQKINGETFFTCSDLVECLGIAAGYLKNILRFDTYKEFRIVLFEESAESFDKEAIRKIFDDVQITYLSLNIVEAYKRVLKIEYGDRENKLTEEKELLEGSLSKLNEKFNELTLAIESYKLQQDVDKKEIARLSIKAKKYEEYLLSKNEPARTILYIPIPEPVVNVPFVSWAREEFEEKVILPTLQIKKISGTKVTKKTRLAILKRHYQTENILAKNDGYVYWLGAEKTGDISFDTFKHRSANGLIALAVISNTQNEQLSKIIEFVEKYHNMKRQ